MEPYGNSGNLKDQPAKRSGSVSKPKVGQSDKQGTATQQVRQGENELSNAQQSDHTRSVMSLSDDEAGSSDVDTQALPGTAIEGNADERHQKISAAAYARAERRGFEPGKEVEDWLRAEAELYGDYTRDGDDDDQEQKREQQRDQNESQ